MDEYTLLAGLTHKYEVNPTISQTKMKEGFS